MNNIIKCSISGVIGAIIGATGMTFYIHYWMKKNVEFIEGGDEKIEEMEKKIEHIEKFIINNDSISPIKNEKIEELKDEAPIIDNEDLDTHLVKREHPDDEIHLKLIVPNNIEDYLERIYKFGDYEINKDYKIIPNYEYNTFEIDPDDDSDICIEIYKQLNKLDFEYLEALLMSEELFLIDQSNKILYQVDEKV